MTPRFLGRRLTTLMGWAALALLLPCFLLTSVAAWKWMAAERDGLASQTSEAADAVAAHLDRYLAGVTGMLQALATSPALDSGDFARFDAQARDVLALQGVHTVLRDLNGKHWVNTGLPWGSPLPEGPLVATRVVAEHGQPYVSDLITGPASKRYLVAVTVPVRRQGKIIYVLGAALAPSAFTQIFAEAGVQSPNTAIIADREGRIVARSDGHDELVGQNLPGMVQKASTRGHWTGVSARGREVFATYRKTSVSGWLVAAGVERAVLDRPLRRMVILLGCLATLLVVSGLVVSTLIARRVLAAHRYLAEVAGRLERQRGSAANAIEVGTTGVVEVDELGRVLANTSSRLLVQAEQLEQVNQELEARIRARTSALEESQHFLRMTLQQMDQGLVFLDPDQTVRLCNPRSNELLRLPKELLHENAAFRDIRAFQNERGDFSLVPEATALKIRGSDARVFPLVYDWPRPDGTTLEVRRVQHADGSSVNTFTDVTERRGAEAAVSESERLYRLLAEHVTDVVTWSRFDTTLLYVSPSAIDVLGYTPEELVGRSGMRLIHLEDRGQAQQALNEIRSGLVAEHTLRLRYRRKDGSLVWTEAAFNVTRDEQSGEPNGYIASLRDVSERQHAEARANHLARHDLLTTLPNRVLFHETLKDRLAAIQESGGTCALFYGDLDRFKTVNDTLGHAVGDVVLKVVAKRLRSALGPDALIARFGGDEFVILLSGEAAEALASLALAQQIIDAVSEPITVERRHVSVGISLGISYAPRDGLMADALLRSADLALFQAKAEGAGTFRVYDPSMYSVVEEKQRLEVDLRQALIRDEFELHYQPIIDLESERVSGAEALLRWRHPERGFVPPATFIPLAEQLGLIEQIGAWVLRQACYEASFWPLDMRIAVNVSAVQFEQAGLIETVVQALAASGLSPTRLELEITETVLMREGTDVALTLDQLRTLGVRMALDDFGTGYSSLSYLRNFRFDKLKLDRSFVADLAHPDVKRIVQAIMALGQGLNMTITAEGVETEAQLDIVRAKGCNEVQGYYFSRPLTATDFRSFIGRAADQAEVA